MGGEVGSQHVWPWVGDRCVEIQASHCRLRRSPRGVRHRASLSPPAPSAPRTRDRRLSKPPLCRPPYAVCPPGAHARADGERAEARGALPVRPTAANTPRRPLCLVPHSVLPLTLAGSTSPSTRLGPGACSSRAVPCRAARAVWRRGLGAGAGAAKRWSLLLDPPLLAREPRHPSPVSLCFLSLAGLRFRWSSQDAARASRPRGEAWRRRGVFAPHAAATPPLRPQVPACGEGCAGAGCGGWGREAPGLPPPPSRSGACDASIWLGVCRRRRWRPRGSVGRGGHPAAPRRRSAGRVCPRFPCFAAVSATTESLASVTTFLLSQPPHPPVETGWLALGAAQRGWCRARAFQPLRGRARVCAGSWWRGTGDGRAALGAMGFQLRSPPRSHRPPLRPPRRASTSDHRAYLPTAAGCRGNSDDVGWGRDACPPAPARGGGGLRLAGRTGRVGWGGGGRGRGREGSAGSAHASCGGVQARVR